MISLYFVGLEEKLKSGMSDFAVEYGFSVADSENKCDLKITLTKI